MESTTGSVKALAAGCVGNFVEWYDFAIYAYSVPIIATLFFPAGNRTLAIFGAFMLYAVAFLARPLGGIFWGNLGDKAGRRDVLAATVLIMGGATMLIGFLPTYTSIGLLAPILLAALRMVQGFSSGGEYTGSISLVAEFAPENRRGFFTSIATTFTTLPSLLGALTVLWTSAIVGAETYISWGWRVPFLIGGPLALVGLFIRLRMEETPAFKAVQEQRVEHTPVRKAIRDHRRSIALVFAIASLSAVGVYTLEAYFVTYLQEIVGFSQTAAILTNFVALFVTVPVVPLIGLLGDRIGRKPLLYTGAAGFIFLSVPAYLLAGGGGVFTAILGQMLIGLSWSFVVSAVAVTQAEIFPTRVRYSGASIGYNLGFMLFGGTAPLVGTYLVSATGSNIAPAIYLVIVALAVVPAVFFLPETSKFSLIRDTDTGKPSAP